MTESITSLDGLLGSVNLLGAAVALVAFALAKVSVVVSLVVASVGNVLVFVSVDVASVVAFVVGAR